MAVVEPLFLAAWPGVGTWPDWIAAVGNVLAFGVIAATLIWQVRTRRQDDLRRRADDERAEADRRDEKARQARLVFARVTDFTDTAVSIEIRNTSVELVRDVKLSLITVDGGKATSVGPRLPMLYHLGPGDHECIEVARPSGVRSPLQLDVDLRFTDANGSRWRKTGSSQPRLTA